MQESRLRIVAAGDEQRRRIERDIHDGAQQRLVALAVALRLVESRLRDDPEGAAEILTGARAELTQALEELRELARGIHPAILTDQGLKPALEALMNRAPIPIELETPSERLAPAVDLQALERRSHAHEPPEQVCTPREERQRDGRDRREGERGQHVGYWPRAFLSSAEIAGTTSCRSPMTA